MMKAAYLHGFEWDYCSTERTRYIKKDTLNSELMSTASRCALTEILRQGAQQMLAMAVENEVAQYIADREDLRDDAGHRLVVRNGHLPARCAESHWRRLNGTQLIAQVIRGIKFIDGIKEIAA